jgi:MFS family permease
VQIPRGVGYGFGASVFVSGLVFLPLSAATFASSRCLIVFERRFGARAMIPLGSAVMAGSSVFFALAHSMLWEPFAAAGAVGAGVGLTFAAMPGFIVRAVPAGETGSATGFYQVLRNVGLAMGSALGAAVLSSYTRRGHIYPTVGGFRTTLLLAGALCLVTAVVSFVLPGRFVVPTEAVSEEEREEINELLDEDSALASPGLSFAEEHLAPNAEVPAP